MVNTAMRLLHHLLATHWGTRRRFPKPVLDRIEQAIARVEALHQGEIRFAVETALPPLAVLRGISASERALDVFAHLRVWDTGHRNGVLIYLQLADRHVEIVADRGISARVTAEEWASVCRLMERQFAAGRFEAGAIAGVEAVGALLSSHFPAASGDAAAARNELPDRPTLL
jgi:uncharacterized membrane protein